MRRPRASVAVDLAIALLVVSVWAARCFAPGRRATFASYDLRMYFYPLYETFYRRLASGRLPLWNPFQLCGLPWLPTLQGGFLYPPHALYLILPTHLALAASGVLHLLFVALSTAAFLRAAGLSRAAVALGAVLFALRGSVVRWLMWPYMLEAVAWLPLGALAVLRIARGDGLPAVAMLALVAGASLLAGSPQATVFLGYAWASLLVALLIAGRAAPAARVGAGGCFLAAMAAAALVAGIVVFPALEMARVGTRAIEDVAAEQMYPLGNPGIQLLREAIAGGPGSFSVLGLALAPGALFSRRQRTLALWAAALGALAFVLALGPVTPLFWLYRHLPALGWFRGPHRLLVLCDFCLAVLAAVAADALRGARSERPILSVAASVAVAVWLGVRLTAARAHLPALWAASAVALVLASARAPRVAAALALLAALEALVPVAKPERLPYDAQAAAAYATYRDTYGALARAQGHDRIWLVTRALLPDLGPKVATRYGVRAIDDYEPVNLRRQAEYFTYATGGSTIGAPATALYDGRLVPPALAAGHSPLATRRRLLDLAAVRLIVVHDASLKRPEVQAFVTDAGLEPRPAVGPHLAAFENPHTLPRAFVVYRTRPAPSPEELLARLSAPGFDPLVESFVEGDPGFVGAANAPARGEPATFVRDEEEVVELDATLAAPGLLVLSDSFYPGWRATADGVAAPILATNHLFRGVPLAAGRHRVRFEYAPRSVRLGMIASVLSAAALAGLAFRRRDDRARDRRPGQVAA